VWTLCIHTLQITSSSLLPSISVAEEEVTVKKPGQKWGYVAVRPEAHMFWWLYMSTNPKGYTSVPLVLWLQVCFPPLSGSSTVH